MFDDLRPANFGSIGRNSTLIGQGHIVNGSLQPMTSGAQQIMTFVVGDDNHKAKTFYISLRAVDRDGLVGDVSNIIAAPFPAQIESSGSRLSTKAIVGIAIGSLLVLLLVGVISYLIAKKKYLSYSKAETRSKP